MNEPPNSRYLAEKRSGQPRGLGDQVRPGLEVRQLLAAPAAALVARAHPDDLAPLDEERLRGGLAEDVDPGLLRLLGQPATELCDGGDVVPVVSERRRDRMEGQRPLAVWQQVRRVLADRAIGRPLLLR